MDDHRAWAHEVEDRARRHGLDHEAIESNGRHAVRHEQRNHRLQRLVGRRENGHNPAPAIFDELAGPDGITEKRTTFTREDAIVAIACRLEGGADRVLQATDAFLADARVLPTKDGRYTTLELVEAERRLIGQEHALNGCGTSLTGHSNAEIGGLDPATTGQTRAR